MAEEKDAYTPDEVENAWPLTQAIEKLCAGHTRATCYAAVSYLLARQLSTVDDDVHNHFMAKVMHTTHTIRAAQIVGFLPMPKLKEDKPNG